LPAGEDEEGLLAEVMLFFLKICGYYFVVLRISVTYPLIIHNNILEKTLPRPSEQHTHQNHSFRERLLGMR
jgi:hypothetical protein